MRYLIVKTRPIEISQDVCFKNVDTTGLHYQHLDTRENSNRTKKKDPRPMFSTVNVALFKCLFN